uniref:Uncharacterized protein n=1 Tax=Micrurus corallinus TaxID=54390 RepID=A0A2D4EPG4_MICCO
MQSNKVLKVSAEILGNLSRSWLCLLFLLPLLRIFTKSSFVLPTPYDVANWNIKELALQNLSLSDFIMLLPHLDSCSVLPPHPFSPQRGDCQMHLTGAEKGNRKKRARRLINTIPRSTCSHHHLATIKTWCF